MILRSFPSRRYPIPPDLNTIVHTDVRNVLFPDQSGPLSIKCAFGGRAYVIVDGVELPIDDRGYVVINSGQSYTCRVPKGNGAELLCCYFTDTFAHDVLAGLVQPADHLLDNPDVERRQSITFFDQRYTFTPAMSRRLQSIRRTVSTGSMSQQWIDKRLRSLLTALLDVHRDLRANVDRMDAARPATRAELFRRLCHARDVIESSFHRGLTIAHLAEVAHLSPHHFLRRFKQFFGETPHQMLRRRRLEEACALLKSHAGSVAEICRMVGFESPSTFTTLFGQVYGYAPDRWRQRRRS